MSESTTPIPAMMNNPTTTHLTKLVFSGLGGSVRCPFTGIPSFGNWRGRGLADLSCERVSLFEHASAVLALDGCGLDFFRAERARLHGWRRSGRRRNVRRCCGPARGEVAVTVPALKCRVLNLLGAEWASLHRALLSLALTPRRSFTSASTRTATNRRTPRSCADGRCAANGIPMRRDSSAFCALRPMKRRHENPPRVIA